MDLFLSALLIFGLRLVDVSLGTLRIILLSRRERLLPALVGFVEVFTWVVAATQVFANLNSPTRMVAYAAGFAVGTYLGATVEPLLAMGTAVMRVISPVDSPQVDDPLREAGFRVTTLNAEGRDGDVRLAFTLIPRRRIREAMAIVHQRNPRAVVTLQDVEMVRLPYGRGIVK
jgi:uncharacterized protein YebE (UPF0316 family)